MRIGQLALLCLLLLSGVGQAAGLGLLTAPWPSGGSGPAGTPVTFPSTSPFSPVDVGKGPAVDPPTTAMGTLFLPPGATAASPAPAVVMLHGAAGVREARELTYGRQLAQLGVAVLVVDAFAARRDRATGFNDRLLEITESMVLADAYAGLRYLAARPDVDGKRIALTGFSYGGMATIYAAYARVAAALAPDGQRFVGHVAFYGPCIARFAEVRTTGAPILMMYGGRDEIIDPPRCAEIAGDLRAGGSAVEVTPTRKRTTSGTAAPSRPGGPGPASPPVASASIRTGRSATSAPAW